MKILVIEDNRMAADALCRLLHERMDFVECKIVTTLKEGKEEAIIFKADVTVMDIMLPDATKQQVLDAIRELPPPVVVVSALIEDDPELAAQCWDHGAKGVLSKRGLLEKIQTLDGVIQKVRFIDAITGSHLRATARTQRASIEHGNRSF